MASEADGQAIVAQGDTAAKDDWMRSVAGQISFLSTGDRAALRRMELTRSRAADGIVVKLLCRAKIPEHRQTKDFDRWRQIAHVAAILSGTGATKAHDEWQRLGAALHAASYSENRLLRLLSARGEALGDQLRRAARMLARGGKPVNLWLLYHLIGDDPTKAEAARVRIAQEYYAAEARSEKGAASDD